MAKPIAGILDLFNTQGSQLQGQATATTSPTLVASTPQSKLHGTFDGDFGYSTAGFFFDEVNAQWQAYNDDMSNGARLLKSSLDNIKVRINRFNRKSGLRFRLVDINEK